MAKDTSKDTGKGTGAATAPAETPAKRTRTAFSKEKKIGYMLLSALAVLGSKAVQAVLTEEQKATVAKANESAKAIGAEDPFKAVDERIKAIQKEMTDLKAPAVTDNEAFTKYVAQVKEHGLELDRQIKRKNQIKELLGK